MSDDELPPPPPKGAKPVVTLDQDSDDDGLPPPPPKTQSFAGPPATMTIVAQTVVLEDSDDDEGLPPPPPKPNTGSPSAKPAKPAVDDDDDDDLPPPPGATKHADPAADADDDDLPPPPSTSKAPTSPKPTSGNGTAASEPPPAAAEQNKERPATQPAATSSAARRTRKNTIASVKVSAVEKKGWLMKQKPTWPYASQKRWCVLQGRMMNYYETEASENPSGSLDLKGAELVDVSRDAKLPHSFGLTGPSGQLKGRRFIFSAASKDELQEWVEIIVAVSADQSAKELHWFEKMAQGIY